MTHLTYPNESAEYRKARNALLAGDTSKLPAAMRRERDLKDGENWDETMTKDLSPRLRLPTAKLCHQI